MDKKRVINIIKERWKYYVVGYIIGYIVSITQGGVPNVYYFIPIKLFAICTGIGIGTAFYYSSQKIPHYVAVVRSLKYVVIIVILLALGVILEKVLLKFNIDIAPFIGV